MTMEPTGKLPLDPPLGGLERSLIDEFVRLRGFEPEHLGNLPEGVRDALLTEASVYASTKLAEIESRAHYVHDMREGGGG